VSDLIREVDFSDPELLKEEKFSDQELDDAGRDDFLTEVEKDEEEIPMNQLSSETDELAGNTPVTTAPAASPEIEDVLPSGAKATEGKAAVKKFTWDDDSLVLGACRR